MSWRYQVRRFSRGRRILTVLVYLFVYGSFAAACACVFGIDQARAVEVGNTANSNTRVLAQGFRGISITMPEDGDLVGVKAYAQDTGGGMVTAAIYSSSGTMLAYCAAQALGAIADVYFVGCDELLMTSGTVYLVGLVSAGTSATKIIRHGGAAQTFDGVACPVSFGSIAPPPSCTPAADSGRDYAVRLVYDIPPPPPPPDTGNGIEGWFLLGALCLAGVVIFGSEA